MIQISASEKLMELIFKGLDHGIYSIKDGDGPLIPFIMIDTNGEIELKRFMAETIEASVAQAKKYLVDLIEKPELAIMAYDGFLTVEGKKYDAILVNGFEKLDSKGHCFAQRYKPKKFLSRFKEIGNTAFVAELENVLNQ